MLTMPRRTSSLLNPRSAVRTMPTCATIAVRLLMVNYQCALCGKQSERRRIRTHSWAVASMPTAARCLQSTLGSVDLRVGASKNGVSPRQVCAGRPGETGLALPIVHLSNGGQR